MSHGSTGIDEAISLHFLQNRPALFNAHFLGLGLVAHHVVHLQKEIAKLNAALAVLLRRFRAIAHRQLHLFGRRVRYHTFRLIANRSMDNKSSSRSPPTDKATKLSNVSSELFTRIVVYFCVHSSYSHVCPCACINVYANFIHIEELFPEKNIYNMCRCLVFVYTSPVRW